MKTAYPRLSVRACTGLQNDQTTLEQKRLIVHAWMIEKYPGARCEKYIEDTDGFYAVLSSDDGWRQSAAGSGLLE